MSSSKAERCPCCALAFPLGGKIAYQYVEIIQEIDYRQKEAKA